MRYFEGLRQDWIREQFAIYGFVGREHVTRKFGVTAQVVSSDFANLQRLFPGLMTYDKNTKRYFARHAPGPEMQKLFRRSLARDIMNGETSP